jgi:hypothetical protein
MRYFLQLANQTNLPIIPGATNLVQIDEVAYYYSPLLAVSNPSIVDYIYYDASIIDGC